VVIMNPEYGERMGEAPQLETVYKGIGDFLKQKCGGYTGYVFTGRSNPGKEGEPSQPKAQHTVLEQPHRVQIA